MASRQLVVFLLNNEAFGVDITQVVEIQKPMDVVKVPNAPEYIEGIINLRGKVHAIFNLSKKFGFPVKDFDEETKFIIVNVNDISVGFIVDEVSEIIRVEEEDMEPTPASLMGIKRKYLNGVAKVGERVIILLDLKEVMTVDEEEQTAKVINKC